MDAAAEQSRIIDVSTRHISLDALRGFAVMGILAMNIVAFSMPFWAYVTPLAYGGGTSADRISWLITYVLLDGKMRGFFSLLFGASMILIVERASAKGENAAKVHYARMFWLAVIGLAHFYFIWFGDILFLYAVAGSLAFLFRKWDSRQLLGGAAAILALHLLIWGVQFVGLQLLQFAAHLPDADPSLVKRYDKVMADPAFAFDTAKELALHRGDYAGIVADKLRTWDEPFVGLMQTIGETLPLMMLGMAMMKNGFLTAAWPRADYARWAKMMLIPGLLLSAATGAMIFFADYDRVTSLAAFFVWSAIPRTMVTIGYIALLMLVVTRYPATAFIQRVAAAGRAAFTNYLGTSILMTSIFYGYGLGLFGYVDRVALWLFVIGAWAIMLLWSKLWLEHFRFGPFEWLWRSLARAEIQPFRR